MTPSEETRGEKRLVAEHTRAEWGQHFDTHAVQQEGFSLSRLLDAAFSREAEVAGSGEREVWCECCQRDHLLTAEGQKKGEGK